MCILHYLLFVKEHFLDFILYEIFAHFVVFKLFIKRKVRWLHSTVFSCFFSLISLYLFFSFLILSCFLVRVCILLFVVSCVSIV